MKNFIQNGNTINATASAARSSGDGQVIGAILGVAINDIANGVTGEFATEGVFSLPKLSTDAFTVGQSINWNSTTNQFQAATSTLDGAGIVWEAAGNGTTVVRAKINGK